MNSFAPVVAAAIDDDEGPRSAEWEIVEGDALERLDAIKDGTCKLIITSPPYNIGKEYERDQRLTLREYIRWLDKIIAKLCKKVTPDGHICWQSGNFVEDGEVFPLDTFFYRMFKRRGFRLRNRISPTAIAKQVMQRLSASGPLAGHVETYFFEKGKLKTSSIVSYALGPLLKLSGTDSLFSVFKHSSKAGITDGTSGEALEEYLKFAVASINIFLSAVKSNVAKDRWTTDRAQLGRRLTVTYVNAFLITLRMLIGKGKPIEFNSLKTALIGIDKFDFKAFHSSQYNRMAEKIFDKHFT
jgi:hypothetical protein